MLERSKKKDHVIVVAVVVIFVVVIIIIIMLTEVERTIKRLTPVQMHHVFDKNKFMK